MTYHTRVATMAAALRDLAERLDAAGDADVCDVRLCVDFQVAPIGDDRRAASVDLLCSRLRMVPTFDQGIYRSPWDQREPVAGIDLMVFSQTPPPPVSFLDTAQAEAWAMTCADPWCTNLPTPGRADCDECAAILAACGVRSGDPDPWDIDGTGVYHTALNHHPYTNLV